MTNTSPSPAVRQVIFNADDFGASLGVNRGIIECHRDGVLTSASLMMTGRAVDEAVALSREFPRLAIGLHFDVWGEDERSFDIGDVAATRDEFHRQLDCFTTRLGRRPTHIDSHRHAHRDRRVFASFLEWCAPVSVPVRGDGRVHFVGGFYAQWEWKVTNLEYVSPQALVQLLTKEVPPGITELSCHPGYVSDDYQAVYLAEREAEVKTLTDPRIRQALGDLNMQLISYADVPADRAIGTS
jgi:chitin disaccharide deacetylase